MIAGAQSVPAETRSGSIEETERLGFRIAAALEQGPRVLALCGDLGSGKTAVVRGICRYFECAEQVSSPTFTVIQEYHGSADLHHCDLYRLSSEDDMLEAGIDDVLRGGGIVLLEWGERARALLPMPRYELLAAHGEDARERTFRFQLCTDADDSILLDTPDTFLHQP